MTHLTSPRPNEDWLGKANRKLLYEAAINRKKFVTLTDGKVYSLKYRREEHTISWGGHDSVFVQPTDGRFVPCGWYNIDRI